MKFGRQVLSVLATRAAVIGFVFLTGLIVARSVGPSGKGALTVLTSLMTLASVIGGFGLATGGVHLHKATNLRLGAIAGVSLLLWAVGLAVLAVLVGVGGEA